MKLKGKVAVITGAAQGIGKAIALALAREKASVVLMDINLDNAQKVALEAREFSRAIAKRADVSKQTDVAKAVKETLEEMGKIDILVNNAGVDLLVAAEEIAEDQWRQIMDVNLKGTFLCSQIIGKEMIKNRSGKIINISSIGGHCAIPRMVAYNASKAGILLLTKTLAVEWAKYGINVNSVSPGLTETGLVLRLRKEDPQAFRAREERIPLKRVGKPEDIANAVVFFASPASDYITGEDIKVDGGMAAIHPGYV